MPVHTVKKSSEASHPASNDTALPAPNPFLAGPLAPVRQEVSADGLKVIGRIPAHLDGLLVRNGPNPLIKPSSRYHWFDGDGMLHGVRVRDGKASYLNRYVQTESWKKESSSGRYHGVEMNSGPLGFLSGMLSALRNGNLEFANKANTSVVWHHGKLFALWEQGAPYEIRPEDLATIGLETFGGRLKSPFTAHPKIDAVTGEMMFFGYSGAHRGVQYGVLDRDGRLVHSTSIELPRPVLMHDCAITENHTVFLDLPMVGSAWRLLAGRPFFDFRPRCGARFGILPRRGDGSAVKWFEVEPCAVFHVLNAWEEEDRLVVYGCRFPEAPAILKSRRPSQVHLKIDSVMYRWEFDLVCGKVHESAVDDLPVEFPRVDDDALGRRTRIGYTVSLADNTSALVKYDLVNGTRFRHELGAGRFAGEGVFVPRPDRRREDDGHLVSFLNDERENRGEMIVIDCRQFETGPVARVVLPQRVPAGFHGVWINGDELERTR